MDSIQIEFDIAEGIAAASFCEAQQAKDTADSPARAYLGAGNGFYGLH